MVEHDRDARHGRRDARAPPRSGPASMPVGERDGASSDGAGPAEAMSSAAQAPSSAQAPPRSEVSAAVTQTTRSASSSEPWMRTGCVRRASSSGRRSGLVASCTSTVPRKSRACTRAEDAFELAASGPALEASGDQDRVLARPASRGARAGRSRPRPPAGAGRSARPAAAASAARRRSSTRPPRVTRSARRRPGERIAERLADRGGDVAQRIERRRAAAAGARRRRP